MSNFYRSVLTIEAELLSHVVILSLQEDTLIVNLHALPLKFSLPLGS